MLDILPRNTTSWQKQLSQMITDPAVLIDTCGLDAELTAKACEVAKQFPLRVTQAYISKIKYGDSEDPLLKQILPLDLELQSDDEAAPSDPLQEAQFNPVPGLLHKYKNRVLFTLTQNCAIHCRYCFRREFDYDTNTPALNQWQAAFAYIAERENINEVILSGGDPLTLKDNHLGFFIEKIQAIKHVKRVRIHTRVPVVLPDRIDMAFLDLIKTIKLPLIMVMHVNHPNEIDSRFTAICQQLRKHNVVLLNQSVLLKNINDDAQVLIKLQEKLFSASVLPYYLHILDKVKGTKHFFVAETKAKQLIKQLQAELPGYLVPRLVREDAFAESKTLIG
ncbi:MAG: EF-P beta-lysylation protein EpmB [Pseudomonadota bacterium]